ncbi:MAG: hypothetical protein AB7E32_06720 [Desulfovibrio sp.]
MSYLQNECEEILTNPQYKGSARRASPFARKECRDRGKVVLSYQKAAMIGIDFS